ncbi:MAG: hypothetical protein KBG20_03385 [Caldilineaceae bacterium]|nr:hypothetical protein [Caldilineaceae bacterium]MBP8108572.1 hypothetical protein [Caldilineaceae bacterium]MBP8124400.1 hypothetical protein [Caldilineaceae bacterium]MBP9071310.1 hypothetical protein [Caldilineaceae bacterium]
MSLPSVTGESAVEQGPALFISKSLVIQHKVADIDRKLYSLPVTFCSTFIVTFEWTDRSTYGPDCIGGCAEFVVCHMGHRHCVTSRASGFLGGPGRVSGRRVRGKSSGPGLGHGDLAPRPRTRLLDCLTRTLVSRMLIFKEVQHVFRTSRSPNGKKLMVGVLKGATTPERD